MTKIWLTPWSNLVQKVHSQMTNLWLRLDQVFLVKVLSVMASWLSRFVIRSLRVSVSGRFYQKSCRHWWARHNGRKWFKTILQPVYNLWACTQGICNGPLQEASWIGKSNRKVPGSLRHEINSLMDFSKCLIYWVRGKVSRNELIISQCYYTC